MKTTLFLFSSLSLALAACGDNAPKKNAGSGEIPQSPEDSGEVRSHDGAYNETLAAEYQKLPQMLLVAAESDGSGGSPMGSISVRELDEGVSTLRDGEGAKAAFERGRPTAHRSPDDELGTSTASWSPIGSGANLETYQPLRYSSVQQGLSYAYGLLSKFSLGNSSYYAYQKPPCAPAYCAPQTGLPVGQPGVVPPGYSEGELRRLLLTYNVRPLADGEFLGGTREQIALGGRLFYDKLLSARGDVACASCHIEERGTTGPYSISPIGQVLGGQWRGALGVRELLIRNSPAIYNLGHASFNSLFWDSRVARDPNLPGGYRSPAGAALPPGLNSPLAVQSLFPLVTGTEMGCGIRVYGPSQTPDMPREWAVVMQRILARQEYRSMFSAAFPDVPPGSHSIVHLGNAIAAFEAWKWRADGSPFDRYLRGDVQAMTPRQLAGATYFYGKARCATCHSGALQTDQGWHAIAVPQWGPGAGDGPQGLEDWGVGRITNRVADRYKFRTPSLRNVTLTGPWGHNGAYASLREFVAHYRQPVASHDRWNPWQIILPQGYASSPSLLGAWNLPEARRNLVRANEFPGVPLSDPELDAILDFLGALTDPRSAGAYRGGAPRR